MNDIMKIVQALEDINILLKGVTKTIKNETKEEKGSFLSMLLGTLRASLLGNFFNRKRICKSWRRNYKSCLWFFNFKKSSNSTTYYENEPRFPSRQILVPRTSPKGPI